MQDNIVSEHVEKNPEGICKLWRMLKEEKHFYFNKSTLFTFLAFFWNGEGKWTITTAIKQNANYISVDLTLFTVNIKETTLYNRL